MLRCAKPAVLGPGSKIDQMRGSPSKKIMNAQSNNGASFLESCFGAPYTFATKPGTPLEVNTAYVPGP